jgi:ATP-dependent DNA ligase
VKVKHARTADCVVGGFRWHKDGEGVGSLLLGLHDASGVLHHVGVATGFSAARRRALVEELAPLRMEADGEHPWAGAGLDEAGGSARIPGGPSRWNQGRDTAWVPLRPERVVEVAYDHLQGERFRHATRFLRWRPDRTPESCTREQLETATPIALEAVLGADA